MPKKKSPPKEQRSFLHYKRVFGRDEGHLAEQDDPVVVIAPAYEFSDTKLCLVQVGYRPVVRDQRHGVLCCALIEGFPMPNMMPPFQTVEAAQQAYDQARVIPDDELLRRSHYLHHYRGLIREMISA